MTLAPLLGLLGESAEFEGLIEGLQSKEARLSAALPESATGYVIAAAWQRLAAPMVVLAPRPEAARRLVDQLLVWLGDDAPVYQFGEIETLPYERLTPDQITVHGRVRVLAVLSGYLPGPSQPPLVVASVSAASQMVLEARAFRAATHTIHTGDEASLDDLSARWVDMGYSFGYAVEAPGMASRRGGILDVYPPSLDAPIRIEFFGDEVESIRRFDPASQRSIGPVDSVTIIPAHDTLPALADPERVRQLIGGMDFESTEDDAATRIIEELNRIEAGESPDGASFYAGVVNHDSLFDYLPGDAAVIALRPAESEDVAKTADGRLARLQETKERRGEVPRRLPQPYLDWGLISDAVNAWPHTLRVSPWGADEGLPGGVPRLPFLPASTAVADLERLWDDLALRRDEGARTLIVSQHAARLADLAKERNVAPRFSETVDTVPDEGSLTIIPGSLRHGFTWAPSSGRELLVLTDTEVFGVMRERRPARRTRARRAARLQDLQAGAYLVHIEHGIGRFAGTVSLEGDPREYLLLEYAEGDKLYVPMEQLDRLSPYHGSGETAPRLTRLGSQEWTRAKARARRATEQLAGELIALYAARALAPGLGTGADTPWQDQLEASFPFEETEDQATVIGEVKADLERTVPMDRLICGDVGYGKTEVAIRATFKVVQSGRQVAVLVPTTVLAQQHVLTFRERLAGFPVTVGALSRLVNDIDQRRVVGGLATGEVDIVIGTHRLLQKDVAFKDLGLVVIDEEHRFGVAHKERLKRMRRDVDVMTMSATPIPRTLYFSLAGVRDMSTIDTPPEDRLPIKTYVSEDSAELAREAILREIDRGGQVFFVHNRVKTIDRFAIELRKLVPEASIGIGHGQMVETELESVMAEFTAGGFDILLSTTIIESGLDLPNVNTLIVDRADRFGLSQLYQLRGRIGRGTRRAYAYFLVPRGKQLTETAEQRLNTIMAATELGAGYQIAMRDLEIRGAGNILGAEQSGHITAVGFDLYTRLLNQAVAELKAETDGKTAPADREQEFSLVKVDLGIDARIPYTYVEDLAERLTIYQRLPRLTDLRAVADMEKELRDRFGPLPVPAQLLLYSVRIRILAGRANISSVTAGPERLVLTLQEATADARPALAAALGRSATVGHMQVRMDIDRQSDEWRETLVTVMKKIADFRKRALAMLERAAAAATAG